MLTDDWSLAAFSIKRLNCFTLLFGDKPIIQFCLWTEMMEQLYYPCFCDIINKSAGSIFYTLLLATQTYKDRFIEYPEKI